MKFEKVKKILIKSLGFFTTLLSFVVIYLILFKDGHLQDLTTAVIVEFIVLTMLAVSTKFFWYTSTENSVRTSNEYLDKRKLVIDALDEEVVDAEDFDSFIDAENENNYYSYIADHCGKLTAKNYEQNIFDKFHYLFNKRKLKQKYANLEDTKQTFEDFINEFYMQKYKRHIEYKALKLHKLSGSSIRSLTRSTNGLIDDRNFANTRKTSYLISTTLMSVAFMFVTALISFTNKDNIDLQRAILKMTLYTVQILLSILQSVLTARITVNTEDIAYFNRVIGILHRYRSYKRRKDDGVIDKQISPQTTNINIVK